MTEKVVEIIASHFMGVPTGVYHEVYMGVLDLKEDGLRVGG